MTRPDLNAQKRNHLIPSPLRLEYLGDHYINLADFAITPTAPASIFTELFAFDKSGEAHRDFNMIRNNQLSAEEYRIEILPDAVNVEASSERGFFYIAQTLRQLKVGNLLPTLRIHDLPAMPLRGFHTQLGNISQLEADSVKNIIRMLGKFKINTYLIEYEDRFPLSGHPALVAANAFSREDIAKFESLAAANHIEIIPLVQCLGHVRHIGRHAEYRSLAEADQDERYDQFCPLNDRAFELFTEIASEVMAAHPNSRYFHVGADETRSLGICPECAEKVRKFNKGKLYTDYLNKVCEWMISRGRIPIIWDDMLSSFPGCLTELNKNTVIMYWDYWTVDENNSSFFVDRISGNGIVHDFALEEAGFPGVAEPELTLLKKFSHPKNIAKLLAHPDWTAYRHYLKTEAPAKFRSFPYLQLFKDHGFQVIAAPTTLGNYMDDIYGLPNYSRFRGNIRSSASKAKNEGISGLVTTSWYNFPAEMLDLGLIDTAQNCWSIR